VKKKTGKDQIYYDESANQETIIQIMNVYASGVMDQPDGQYHVYNENTSEEE
jgi:hypothetical protein